MKTNLKGIKFLGITTIIASAALAATLCACTQKQDLTVGDTSFTEYEFTQQTPTDGNVTYERLKVTNEHTKRKGIYGDGCQWQVSLESSKTGDLMLYGLDVAGLFRSLDHGETWESCNNGILNRGVGMFAIDPINSKHVLAAGLGNQNRDGYGMWRSDDMCQTWNATAPLCIGGERYIWDGLEFDPTSVHGDICTDVYYSAPYMRDRNLRLNSYELPEIYGNMDKAQAGLYKSEDGGDTFRQLNSDERLSDGILKITDTGRVFIGNQHGLFEVDENGTILAAMFENVITDYAKDKVTRTVRETGEPFEILKCNMGVTGLDCVKNTLYVQTWDAIYKIDTDKNLTAESITKDGNYPDVWAQMITVSPKNPNRMIFMGRDTYWEERSCWNNPSYISEDGGKTWQKSVAANADTVMNTGTIGREKLFIMDPQNEMRVITFGSDNPLISNNGGKNFIQANGVSNMMVGGKLHYNFYDPDLMLYAAQDYIGMVTTDGGKTYRRLGVKLDGQTYANMYGGFAADCNTYYGFVSTGTNWYGTFKLVVTHNAGFTWTDTGLISDEGMQQQMLSSMQAYSDFNTLFAGPYISHDMGYTWERMNGCDMVLTGNPTGEKEMYGDKNGNVVVSYDAGRTWQRVYDKPLYTYDEKDFIDSRVTGIAFDQVNRYVYALCYWRVWNPEHTEKWTDTYLYKIDIDAGECKRLEFPNYRNPDWTRINDIAIDPNCTKVLYIGVSVGHISCPTSFSRSIDGGESWTVLTRFKNDTFNYDKAVNDGGYCVTTICVSPIDGKVTLGSSCYGFYQIDPPYDNSKLKNVTPKKHTIKYICDGKLIATKHLSNSRFAENLLYDKEGYTLEGWYEDEELTVPHDFSKRTYNSMRLYAKMEKAERVKFIVGGKCIYECDIDAEKLMFGRIPEPKREGYVFGGWFTDESLTERADVYALTESCSLYAGFYKDGQDVFDPQADDFADYIDHVDSSLHWRAWASNDEVVENRCVLMTLDKNAEYFITFTMDTRFRFGQVPSAQNFWQWYPITELPSYDYYIDKDDVDGYTPVNKPVYYVIDTTKNNMILLYYWTITSPNDFMTVKNSIHIYKLVGTPVN